MVQYVVLNAPECRATSHQVQDPPNEIIDSLTGAVGAMVGIMHDIQSNPRQTKTHHNF